MLFRALYELACFAVMLALLLAAAVKSLAA